MKWFPAGRVFARNEEGSATIEAVLWLPVFIAFFCLFADASFIFFGQNKAYRLVQDVNRKLSVGRLDSADAVVADLQEDFNTYAPNAMISSNIDSGMVITTVSIPASDLVATGLYTALLDSNVVVSASHYIEY